MLPPISVHLLGATRLDLVDAPIQQITPHLQSLTAYLILQCRQPQSRLEIVADLLPELPRNDALRTLEDWLAQLTEMMSHDNDFLHMDGSRVQVRLPDSTLVDVDAFENALARAERAGSEVALRDDLIEAVSHYGGDFVPGAQNHWVQRERERLHRRFADALMRLVLLLEEQRDFQTALRYGRRLLEMDPAQERRYRHLLHLHVLHGERAGIWRSLERHWRAAVESQGVLVLIGGEPGVGKSTLAQTFGETVEHARSPRGYPANQAVVRGKSVFALGRSYEQEAVLPFGPWQAVLAQVQQATGVALGDLPEPFGAGAPAASDYQLQQILRDFLSALSRQQPLVLLLDDLQWADQDSLQLLEFVTRDIEWLPLLIIATYRTDALQPGQPLHAYLPNLLRNRTVEHIQLGALSADDTKRLVQTQLGPPTPDLVHYLYARSGGNPLFLVELLRDLNRRQLLTQDGLGNYNPPVANTPVPILLQQLIEQRVARLGAQVQEFLNVASVAGGMWRLSIVEELLGWPEALLLGVLEALTAAGLVRLEDPVSETYRFGHDLFREVFYARQMVRHRRRLHGQLLLLLESNQQGRAEPESALMAYHAYQAGHWARALRYGLMAGEAARRRYANHSALQFFRQAQEAAGFMQEAAAPEVLVRLAEQLGETHMALNHKQELEAAFTHMLATARRMGDKKAESRALSQLSNAYTWLYRYDDAVRTGEAALKLAHESGDRHALALNHYNLGHLYIVSGKLDQAEAHLRQVRERAEQPALQARAAQNQTYRAAFIGEYINARALGEDAVRHARISRDGLAMTGALWTLAYVQVEQGEYAIARDTMQEALDLVEESGTRHYHTKLLNLMGHLYNEVGNYAEARRWNQKALASSRVEGQDRNREAEYYALLNLATDELHAGQMVQAQSYRRAFESILDDSEYCRYRWMTRYHLLCTEQALAEGNYTSALDSAAEALRRAEEPPVPKNICKSRLFAGQAYMALGEVQKATTEVERAAAIADRLAHGSLRWKTRLRLAQIYAAQNRPITDLCREALGLVEACAARLYDPTLAASLLASPLVLELTATARSAMVAAARSAADAPNEREEYPAGLTAREVDVVRLMAQGATNRKIGELLHISVKTVNTHITHILNKTGCENRVAATAFALQHGLMPKID